MKLARHARMALVAVLGLALLGGSVAVAPVAGASHEPQPLAFDYTKVEGLSQPTYEVERFPEGHARAGMVKSEVVEIPAHDGINLYVEIVRPKADLYPDERFPVILEASPYHGTLADRDGTRIFPGPRDDQGRPIGLTGYFAPRGYAVAMMDLRGTGRSEGCLDHLGPNDAKDLKTVIEWLATQPWSNGRVGMTGHSYVGSTPSVAAAQNPKGLKTIVPSAGLASMYHHQFQGGVPYFLQWAGPMEAYPEISTTRHLPGEDNFRNDMEYFGCGWLATSLTAGEDQLSGRYADWHAARDWNEGATAARIPVFMVHGVNDNAARIAAIEWFNARQAYFAEAGIPRPPDKAWIGQWNHGSNCCPNRRGVQWTFGLHGWFDRHLQQRDVKTGPRAEVFMSDGTFNEAATGDRDEVLVLNQWPGSPQILELWGTGAGSLVQRPPQDRSLSFTGTPEGFVSQTSARGVEFITTPLQSDLVLAGVPELDLSASVTVPRVHLIANLFHRFVDEDGDVVDRRISQFAINPELRNGIDQRENVTPGERYDMAGLEGFAMGHHLHAGDRLVLKVTTSDPDKVPAFAADPQVTVFLGAEGTQVRVPVVSNPAIWKDRVPMADTAPVGEAQEGYRTTQTALAPGLGERTPANSTFFEFDALEGFDNAQLVVTARDSLPADTELFLQKQLPDGSWSGDVDGATTFDIAGAEILTTDTRVDPGRYRLEVNNYLGPPGNTIAITLQFFNNVGEPGPMPE